ncbi:MAG TPA: hypothetical protein PLE30_07805 [Candidatus Kapabacteria bacterium]|nr:hypothetical protein [Candidatus Kapabacteria bacterium]
MKRLIIIIAIFTVALLSLNGVTFANDVQYVDYSDTISQNILNLPNYELDSIDLSLQVIIHNSSMFKLYNININGTSYSNIEQQNDSLFIFNIKSYNVPKGLSINYIGKVLAGNDSIFNISIKNFSINNDRYSDSTYTFKVKSQYKDIIYIRFPEIFNLYPNPISNARTIFCEFASDIVDSLAISLYDIKGRKLLIKKLYNTKKGRQILELEIPQFIYAGLYFFVINDKFGYHSYKFEVIK